MGRYEIKIDLNVWYDKNFSIEASSREDAEHIAKRLARESVKNLNLNILDGWEYGDISFDTVYIEEETQ